MQIPTTSPPTGKRHRAAPGPTTPAARSSPWPPVRLRRAVPKDAQALWSLCCEAASLASLPSPASPPLPLRETLFETPCRGWAWLAEVDGQLVGMAVASAGLSLPAGTYCLSVDGWYVRPAWRGRGLGDRLIVHVQAMAAEMGCQEMRLPDGQRRPISQLHDATANA